MVKTSPFWRLLATVPFLVLFLQGPASAKKPEGPQPVMNRPALTTRTAIAFPAFLSLHSSHPRRPAIGQLGTAPNLIVDGKLRLTLDDAIALALENNLEIAVTRYDLPIAQTDLLRAKGGGATRGVAGSYQSTTLFPAVWVSGAAPEALAQAAPEASWGRH